VGVAVLLNGLAVQGQDLPALTARLKNLKGTEAVRVEVVVEADTTGGGSETPAGSEKLRLRIVGDPNGLKLTVQGAIAETHLLREFSLFRANEIVHYGPSLVRELAGMKLVESRPDTREGIPCTRWVLEATEKRSQLGVKATVRKTVELWLDADGYPMAASFVKKGVSRVLLLKVTRESKREQQYKRVGDRLVITLDKTEDADRAGKSKEAKRTVTTTTQITNGATP
jgi:soluble cytochrome b562